MVLSVDEVIRSEPPLVVRVHRPRSGRSSAPCVLGLHGGGYVFGSRAAQDERLAHWCTTFDCVAVSVEYRLAPEAPYPAALEDSYCTLSWVVDNADRLGIDVGRVGVYGPSAGGGLAAALALYARDKGAFRLGFQVLEAAMLDDRQTTASSRADELAIWNRESNAFGWASYLGPLARTADLPAYAAAGRAGDLSGLPPALVIVGGADGFRDENVAYAVRLADAGVPTDLHVVAGAPHGVQMFADSAVMHRWNSIVENWLGGVLGPVGARSAAGKETK
ncbi:alpha/beta hydrolase [Pseudonocardia ailaonensis]